MTHPVNLPQTNPKMSIQISPLTESDIPGAITAIQEAFADDPYNNWVYDKSKVRSSLFAPSSDPALLRPWIPHAIRSEQTTHLKMRKKWRGTSLGAARQPISHKHSCFNLKADLTSSKADSSPSCDAYEFVSSAALLGYAIFITS
jgi:hypothetical protein